MLAACWRILEFEGVQIEDKIPLTQQDKEQMFVDILPDIPEDDGVAYLTFYLDPDLDAGTILAQVRGEMETDACICRCRRCND